MTTRRIADAQGGVAAKAVVVAVDVKDGAEHVHPRALLPQTLHVSVPERRKKKKRRKRTREKRKRRKRKRTRKRRRRKRKRKEK